MNMVSLQSGMRRDLMQGGETALNMLTNMQERLGGKNMNHENISNIVGNLWQRQENDGPHHESMSPQSGESDGDLDIPVNSQAEIRRDGYQKEINEEEQKSSKPNQNSNDTIGIRSDLLPNHPRPKEGLQGLTNYPPIDVLRRQAEVQNHFLSGLHSGPSISPVSIANLQSNNHSSQPLTPLSSNSNDLAGSWTFEDQYKQLYEIDDNPRRREFLDELFAFMQKRGTPINRLPVMAKTVLDMYELYNQVVARGGLVEVVNKKQWQEIIKGLGLPSSITSAAFTLRSQYTKYLYPFEIANKGFSTQEDLQVAIDSNKREGRRLDGPFGHPLGFSPSPTNQMSPLIPMSHIHPGMPFSSPSKPPTLSSYTQQPQDPLGPFEMTRLALLKLYNQQHPGSTPPLIPNLNNLSNIQNQQNLNIESHQEKAINLKHNESHDNEHDSDNDDNFLRDDEKQSNYLPSSEKQHEQRALSSSPPNKRKKTSSPSHVNNTNMSISNRESEDGRKSMDISLEVNGVTYKGILYSNPC